MTDNAEGDILSAGTVSVTARCNTVCGTLYITGARAAFRARPRPQARLAALIAAARVARRVTVKDKVGRTRYVAFRIDTVDADRSWPAGHDRVRIVTGGSVGRPALSGALPAYARLTRFDGTYGIVRVGHRDRDALVAVLMGLGRLGEREVRVETLATSGTIRGAARALPASSSASRRSPARRD